MQIGAETFYKLHKQHDLPAMRLPGGRWCTSKNLIDGWIVARWKQQRGLASSAAANNGCRTPAGNCTLELVENRDLGMVEKIQYELQDSSLQGRRKVG